jgi:hypothetical protein
MKITIIYEFENEAKDYATITIPCTVDLIGYALKEDFLKINRIENQGYLDNYVLFDSELKDVNLLISNLQKNA